MKNEMNYDYTDKIIAYIDAILFEQYSKLKSLLSFDELNVIENVNEIYADIDKLVRKQYLRLARKTYADYIKAKQYAELDEQWVDELLEAYDPVSKYVFTHEIDRKGARLIEAVLSSNTPMQEIDAALRSMSLMCRIYAIRVTDEAYLQALRDNNAKRVKWIAEKDEKTCSVCFKRDGKIYNISQIPPKPHINCRCTFEKV